MLVTECVFGLYIVPFQVCFIIAFWSMLGPNDISTTGICMPSYFIRQRHKLMISDSSALIIALQKYSYIRVVVIVCFAMICQHAGYRILQELSAADARLESCLWYMKNLLKGCCTGFQYVSSLLYCCLGNRKGILPKAHATYPLWRTSVGNRPRMNQQFCVNLENSLKDWGVYLLMYGFDGWLLLQYNPDWFWYRLTRVIPDKVQKDVKWMCVLCVCWFWWLNIILQMFFSFYLTCRAKGEPRELEANYCWYCRLCWSDWQNW